MPKCTKCGKEDDSTIIKRCPATIKKWADKYLCIECYLKIKNSDEKQKNQTRCLNCGSPLKEKTDTCPYCKYDLKEAEKNGEKYTTDTPAFPKDKKIKITTEEKEEINVLLQPLRIKKPLTIAAVYITIVIILVGAFIIIVQDPDDTQKFVGAWEMKSIKGLSFTMGSLDGREVWRFNEEGTLEMLSREGQVNEIVRNYKWDVIQETDKLKLNQELRNDLDFELSGTNNLLLFLQKIQTMECDYKFSEENHILELKYPYCGGVLTYKFEKVEQTE